MTRDSDLWNWIIRNEKLKKYFKNRKNKRDDAERATKIHVAPNLEERASIEVAKREGQITNIEYKQLYESHLNVSLDAFLEWPYAIKELIGLLGKHETSGALNDDSLQTQLSDFYLDHENRNTKSVPKKKQCPIEVLDAFLVGSTSVNGFPQGTDTMEGIFEKMRFEKAKLERQDPLRKERKMRD